MSGSLNLMRRVAYVSRLVPGSLVHKFVHVAVAGIRLVGRAAMAVRAAWHTARHDRSGPQSRPSPLSAGRPRGSAVEARWAFGVRCPPPADADRHQPAGAG